MFYIQNIYEMIYRIEKYLIDFEFISKLQINFYIRNLDDLSTMHIYLLVLEF